MEENGKYYKYNENSTWRDVENQVGSPELVLEMLDELKKLQLKQNPYKQRKAIYVITGEEVTITGFNEKFTYDALFENGNTIEVDKAEIEFID